MTNHKVPSHCGAPPIYRFSIPNTVPTCSYLNVVPFLLANSCAVLSTFLISLPFMSKPASRSRSSSLNECACVEAAMKLAQTCRREEVDRGLYSMEMWMRDWKATSMLSTRLVVRKRMPE